MIQNVKLELYKSGTNEPLTKVTIPLSVFQIGEKLLPKKAKISLKKEEINLSVLTELLAKEIPKGQLIEIENSEEKIVILVE